jgi:membrane-bound lytic murein transglycosylase D
MKNSLARGEQYLPMMKTIFRENDLPEDLAYLSLVESGFNPHAFSRAGASGPWQFMKGTARRYGLQMNQYVDERKDPEKSTRAAVRYLKDLYSMFGDWYLAVTAYNAGERNVAEAMKKHNTSDFWELQKITHLKAESRDFVPKLLAAITIGKQPEEYGFDELEVRIPHLTKVHVPTPTNLKFLADMAEVSLGELRAYNPELRNSCTPPSKNGYWIKIPVGRKDVFERNFAKNKDKAPASAGSFCEHRIKRGETLSQIARHYRTDMKTLQEINGIKNPRTLSPGRVLRIPLSSRSPS